MELNNVLKEKKERSDLLKNKLWLIKKNKALWLIMLTNKSIIKDLRDWLVNLPSGFVVYVNGIETEKLWNNVVATWNISEEDYIWFDFIVCDDDIENLKSYLEKGITPLISSKNHFSSLLKEFNPLKNEWNSYMYNHMDKWTIFYTIVRYLENYKFPFDNKNLVKNVLAI